MTEIKNALIKSTTLGIEDHGILSCYILTEGDGWGCAFGGYAFDNYDPAKQSRVGTAYGTEFIRRVLDTLDAPTWESLKGRMIRVKSGGTGSAIEAIGHPIKNKWFDPKKFYEEFVEKKESST